MTTLPAAAPSSSRPPNAAWRLLAGLAAIAAGVAVFAVVAVLAVAIAAVGMLIALGAFAGRQTRAKGLGATLEARPTPHGWVAEAGAQG